jgi:peptidyl-prolyl cis-trans isomerase B (cyclophilin B)
MATQQPPQQPPERDGQPAEGAAPDTPTPSADELASLLRAVILAGIDHATPTTLRALFGLRAVRDRARDTSDDAQAAAAREVIGAGLAALGDGSYGRAARLLFGATDDTRGQPARERRRQAAYQIDVMPDWFRRRYVPQIVADVAEHVLTIEHATSQADAATDSTGTAIVAISDDPTATGTAIAPVEGARRLPVGRAADGTEGGGLVARRATGWPRPLGRLLGLRPGRHHPAGADRIVLVLILTGVAWLAWGLDRALLVVVLPVLVFHLARMGYEMATGHGIVDRLPRLALVLLLGVPVVGRLTDSSTGSETDPREKNRGWCLTQLFPGPECPEDLQLPKADLMASGCPTQANGEPAMIQYTNRDERRSVIFTDARFGHPVPVRRMPSCGLNEDKTYRATFTVDIVRDDSFVVELFPELAPNTVNNFVFLARYNYYDWTGLRYDEDQHILETVDPGVGLGEPNPPGYEIRDERPRRNTADYAPFSLCMYGGSRTNTLHGAKFYIILPELDTSEWSNFATCFGRVVTGKHVVTQMTEFEEDEARWPTTITNITIDAD